MTQDKKTVVFVGGFSLASDGSVGGQTFTCRLLLNSPLSKVVNWRLIDTSWKSFPPPGFSVRIYHAMWRMLAILWHCLSRKVDGLLVVTSFTGASLAEKGLMCILARLLGKRVVLCIRYGPFRSRRFRFINWLFAKLVIKSCHVIICQSPIAADRLKKYFGCRESRITVIPNWIDADRYTRTSENPTPQQPRKRPAIVLFVGLLEQRKGVHHLLEAFHQLVEEGISARLVICGSGPERDTLERQSRQLGISDRVQFRGWVSNDDVIAEFHQADVFVLPTFAEGLPNALLEAMACNLPVVTTPVDGIPSVVEDGLNGFLVPPGESDALAKGIRPLLQNPELGIKMGQTNRAAILENHHILNVWPRIAKTLGVEKVNVN